MKTAYELHNITRDTIVSQEIENNKRAQAIVAELICNCEFCARNGESAYKVVTKIKPEIYKYVEYTLRELGYEIIVVNTEINQLIEISW